MSMIYNSHFVDREEHLLGKVRSKRNTKKADAALTNKTMKSFGQNNAY